MVFTSEPRVRIEEQMNGLGRIRTGIVVFATAAGIVAAPCLHAQGSGEVAGARQWKFAASVYAHLPTIGGAMAVPVGGTGPAMDVDASKVLEHLDFTFMGLLDAHHGRWGLLTDLIDMDTGSAKSEYRFGAERAWMVPFHADVGTGESNLTWQASAGIGLGYGRGDLVAMWRYVGYGVKSGNYGFRSGMRVGETDFNGPMVGAVFCG